MSTLPILSMKHLFNLHPTHVYRSGVDWTFGFLDRSCKTDTISMRCFLSRGYWSVSSSMLRGSSIANRHETILRPYPILQWNPNWHMHCLLIIIIMYTSRKQLLLCTFKLFVMKYFLDFPQPCLLESRIIPSTWTQARFSVDCHIFTVVRKDFFNILFSIWALSLLYSVCIADM